MNETKECRDPNREPECMSVMGQVTLLRDLAIYIDRNACGIKGRLGGMTPEAAELPTDGTNLRDDLDGIYHTMNHALRLLQASLEYLG